MAYIRYFNYTRHKLLDYEKPELALDDLAPDKRVGKVPRLFWSDETEWLEASLFLALRADLIPEGTGSIEALRSRAQHLKAYADFIEANDDLEWDDFGPRKRSRPTYRFRGHLIKQRDEERSIAPSTASNRIAAIKAFYQWVIQVDLLNPEHEAFIPVLKKIQISRWYGMRDSISVHSSDLAIPNKGASNSSLEDGLLPISREHRDLALALAREYCTEEFTLALELGFHSGLRIGSIVDLKTWTIENARPSENIKGWYEIALGPTFGVKTKGGVNYWASVSPRTMKKLQAYAESSKRLLRAAKAGGGNSHLLFITRLGGQYTTTSWQDEMEKLRECAAAEGVNLKDFYFHCSRATFGTLFTEFMLSLPKAKTRRVLSILKKLMGHKNEATTLRYIRWVEDRELISQLNDEYGEHMLGPAV